jgi:hypothetical protein
MKERPILFTGEMVRAILDGRKTQTRRVIKQQPEKVEKCFGNLRNIPFEKTSIDEYTNIKCPYGNPGDRLWVRETWQTSTKGWIYKADHPELKPLAKWKSPRFMPRRASRINLEITNIRVERVQDINIYDIEKEGINIINKLPHPLALSGTNPEKVKKFMNAIAQMEFKKLWDSINLKREFGWDSNPWIWVIEFKRLSS